MLAVVSLPPWNAKIQLQHLLKGGPFCHRLGLRFQWERFGNQSLTDSGAFGGGPRLGPGRFLASEAAQRLLAAVLAKDGFSWKLKQGQDLRQQYIPGLFPADGLIVDIS